MKNYKNITFIMLYLIFVLGISNSCSKQNSDNSNAFSQLHVKWRLVENKIHEGTIAEFSFINKSEVPVKYGNWSLFFNQNTLHVGKLFNQGLGAVEHVNGDLYRFFPREEFLLIPGDSISIKYSYKGHLIKKSDCPAGAYFVVNAREKNEMVELPGQFTISGFENIEHIFPDPEILSTVPTPANEYHKNQTINALSGVEFGKILPSPVSLEQTSGYFKLNEKTRIHFEEGLENEAKLLSENIKKLFGLELPIVSEKTEVTNAISLTKSRISVNEVNQEAYHLSVKKDGVKISGSDEAGVFYGTQSLISLVWASTQGKELGIQCVEILDAPRFSYRGFLFDVSRNFHEKEDIFRLIDLLAMYKVNKLNLRITDDEGWRIEIMGLPELTEVGGVRGHTNDFKDCLSPSFGSGPFPDSENNRGKGYYSREDFKEILKYAKAKHIQVIPEVCFPSHARAAIKAMEARYTHFMEDNNPEKANEFRLIDPDDESVYLSAQMYKDNIVCVARPSVYHFYDTVIKDFMDMYEEAGLKMTTFNTGGDEVPKGAWTKSPMCQELLKTLPEIKDARQLQGYFLEKAMGIFEKYDLQVTGWEEIVLNKDSKGGVVVNPKFVHKNVLPLVWDNTDDNIDLGYRIANAGYPVVLCNVTNLYFDLAYNADPEEPGLYWGGFQDAIDPYVMTPHNVYNSANFDNYGRLKNTVKTYEGKQVLLPENKKNIIGIQAQLWSETLRGEGMLEYYTVPKLFAFAEKAWAQAPKWESELNITQRNQAILSGWNRLANQIGQYEFSKIDVLFGEYNYRISPPGAVVVNGELKANVAFPGFSVRYTTDGNEPKINSLEYVRPVQVKGMVKLKSFTKNGKGSKTVSVN